MCPRGVPLGLQQVDVLHRELPQSRRQVRVMVSHLSISAPVPGVSAPASASAVFPAAGNPLLAGVRSAEQGVGR